MLTSAIAATGMAASLFLAPILGGVTAGSDGEDLAAPPGRVTVEAVTVNGSGCPAGTADVTLSSDSSSLRVTYREFYASIGPSSAETDFRKNCQLSLAIHGPAGYTYALAGITHRGFAGLARGASATVRTSSYVQGSAETVAVTNTVNGPTGSYWTAQQTVPAASRTFAPCGEARNLNINTEIRVNAGTSSASRTSFVVLNTTELDAGSTYFLAWRRCPTS